MLAHIAAREGKIGLEHPGHFIDVLAHRLDFGSVAEQCQFELETGEHRAQVVRHAGEHGGPLLDRALDACLHLDEGKRRTPHFARAARTVIRHVASLAESLRRVGEPQDRPDLIAQEYDRDRKQDQRRADHPEQENLGIRCVGRAARRKNPHDVLVELNADFDQS